MENLQELKLVFGRTDGGLTEGQTDMEVEIVIKIKNMSLLEVYITFCKKYLLCTFIPA